MKLRDLIYITDKKQVYNFLQKLHDFPCEELPSINNIEKTYSKILDTLLLKSGKENSWPILVQKELDWYYTYLLENPDKVTKHDKDLKPENYTYIHVNLVNPDYIAPDPKLKPWGGDGDKEDDAPEGYYNCNLNKYNQYFAFMAVDWNDYIEAEVLNSDGLSNEEVLSSILFEISFYGNTEEKIGKFWDEIDKRVEEIKIIKKSSDCLPEEGEDNRYE